MILTNLVRDLIVRNHEHQGFFYKFHFHFYFIFPFYLHSLALNPSYSFISPAFVYAVILTQQKKPLASPSSQSPFLSDHQWPTKPTSFILSITLRSPEVNELTILISSSIIQLRFLSETF